MSRVSILDMIVASGAASPDAPALRSEDRTEFTYAELAREIDGFVATLRRHDIDREARVAIVLADGPATAAIVLAVASAAIACPLNPAYRVAELEANFANLEATALVVDPARSPLAVAAARSRGMRIVENGEFGSSAPAREPERVAGDAVALMLHTSGTTARPKLVPLSHANLVTSATNIARWLELAPSDRCFGVMPLFHIHGLVGALLASLSAGASVVCTHGFDAASFFASLRATKATWYTAVPTMHQAIVVRAERDGPSPALRFVRSSSAALAPPTARALREIFRAPVIEAYGMTEAAHQMYANPLPPGSVRDGSVGLPVGIEGTVLDERGRERPSGEIGEVAVRGASVMAGYHDNPKANADAFVRDWFRTGDLGRLDADGYLYLVGRLREMINRGGEKISPREIDEALLEHPAVAAAVAFAIPDERLGEDVGAAVILRPGASVDAATLMRFVATRLADFKVPRRIVFRDEIPVGPTGKLQRIGLAAALGIGSVRAPESTSGATDASASPYDVPLATIWCDVFGVATVDRDADFFALGGDSLLAMRVIARIREAFARELTIAAFFAAPTLANVARAIEDAPPCEAELPTG